MSLGYFSIIEYKFHPLYYYVDHIPYPCKRATPCHSLVIFRCKPAIGALFKGLQMWREGSYCKIIAMEDIRQHKLRCYECVVSHNSARVYFSRQKKKTIMLDNVFFICPIKNLILGLYLDIYLYSDSKLGLGFLWDRESMYKYIFRNRFFIFTGGVLTNENTPGCA